MIKVFEIDISTLEGRNIVRKLEKQKKYVKLTYPLPFENNELPDEAFFESEAFAELEEKLKSEEKLKTKINESNSRNK